jgi:hypothetical protein
MAFPKTQRLLKHFPFLVVELALGPFSPVLLLEANIVPGEERQVRSLLTLFLGVG